MYRIAAISDLNCTPLWLLLSLVHFYFRSIHKPISMEQSKFSKYRNQVFHLVVLQYSRPSL